MTFGTGGDQGGPPSGGFDFMLGNDAAQRNEASGVGVATGSPVTPHQGFDFSDRPRRDRRKASRIDSSAVVRTAVVLVLAVAVVAGAGFAGLAFVQNAEAGVKADSAAFCADLATTPGVLTEAGFGWPSDSAAGIAASLESMKSYQARWQNLATVGPPTIRPDLTAIASAAATITASVESSNTIDRSGNLAAINAVTGQTAVRAWAKKYCD